MTREQIEALNEYIKAAIGGAIAYEVRRVPADDAYDLADRKWVTFRHLMGFEGQAV